MKAQDLKNSVLQLAIQGKLVEQNSNDEPASVLLGKIKSEKEQLIKEKKIKREKPLPEIGEEEKPFEIPDTWKWIRHNDIFEISGGSQPAKSNFIDYEKEGYIRLYQTRDYGKSPQPVYIPVDMAKKISQKGDILLARYGASLGKVFLAEDGAYNVALAKVIPLFDKKLIDNRFLFWYYKSSIYQEFVSNRSRSAQAGFNKDDLNSLLFPLPPLEEQKRIVAKIEEVLEKIEEYDKVEKELSKLEKAFPQDMKKSILQYAIQGKLVEQNHNDEPASILLEKIKVEKEKLIKEKKIKKEKPLPEISEEEKRYELPNGWQWARIGDVAQINPRNKIDDDLETSFIPMKLIEDGYSNFHTMETRKWKEIKSGFTHFEEYDVVLAKITPCFQNRKSAIMKNLINGVGAGTTELYVLRPYGKYVLSEFLLYLVKSHDFIEGGVRTYTGTAGQQRVKKEFVENYVFALPPIEEQRRIVSELDRAFEIINKLENKINNVCLINKIVKAKTIEVEDKKVLISN